MKWLLLCCGLVAATSLAGCCRPGGLFSQPAYGPTYTSGSYYGTPTTTYAAAPCSCQ
ncbi:MAG TPA: hypothetical protein VFW87_20280 [Pirellulales bacterium]|nr:hypothetical protein [Pirellulales bacterium]